MTNGLFNRRAIYNELDPYASEWLRRLIKHEHITPGEVVEGDIAELTGATLADAQRFHAFAGIGVWDYALQLAGWPPDVPVWTGSCPCQPFSVAGRKRGTKDERHLWPEWFRLIDECRPPVIFGEQVASPLGRDWFYAVRTDLETLGYAVGAADLCAAGVGSPMLRQRIFFVGVADVQRREEFRLRLQPGGPQQTYVEVTGPSEACVLANTRRAGDEYVRHEVDGAPRKVQEEIQEQRLWADSGDGRTISPISDAESNRWPAERQRTEAGYVNWIDDLRREQGATKGFWGNAEWVICRDGKARALEPGTCPMAHGSPEGMGKLRAYGNAIVPQVAAVFIEAALRSIRHEFV